MFEDIMSGTATWLFLAFVVERLVEWLSNVIPWLAKAKLGELKVQTILSFAISIVFSFGANLNFFEIFAIPFSITFVGPIITALFMSGGSNLVHDIISLLTNKKEEVKLKVAAANIQCAAKAGDKAA